MLKLLLVAGLIYAVYKSTRPTTIGNQPSTQGTISSDGTYSSTVGGYPMDEKLPPQINNIRLPGQISAQGQVEQSQPSWRYYDTTEYVYESPVTPNYAGNPSNNFRALGDNYGARQ